MGHSQKSIDQITEHLFRNFYQEVFSSLIIRFGPAHMDLIEDAIQETFYKALKSWKYDNQPKNPKGWLFTVTKNELVNQLRRGTKSVNEPVPETFEVWENDMENNQNDSQLQLFLACARLKLSGQPKLIFTLKSICGFGVAEIANGLLLSEDNVYKQLQRCKNKLKKLSKSYFTDLKISDVSKNDVEYLTTIIYFMFNEGYDPINTKSESPINKEFCFEAVRLAHLLANYTEEEKADHLLSLCYFHMARFDSRTDGLDNFVSLRKQDRNKWDKDLMTRGFHFLKKPKILNRYYVEALIASQHLRAASFEDTDWGEILKLYNLLLKMNDSEVIRLNRAICLFELGQDELASKELERLKDSLADNYLYYSVSMAEYLADKNAELSKYWYEKSLETTKQEFRKQIIQRKLSQLQ